MGLGLIASTNSFLTFTMLKVVAQKNYEERKFSGRVAPGITFNSEINSKCHPHGLGHKTQQ